MDKAFVGGRERGGVQEHVGQFHFFAETFQLPRGWLNDDSVNMSVSETSQLPIGWLKDEAPPNMLHICLTEETLQSPIGLLKERALLNIAPNFNHITFPSLQ